ncbi:magnesium transporter CorA family protein [Legionella dresdenensis]|uniref:Magnesium transporter CorA family protein n=1 Tax=Legionella dresdenensis TaxID=450200 RepID=A0ABV8CBT5_9GAMM
MITVYLASHGFKPLNIDASNVALLKNALWIDMLSPTPEEEGWVESHGALEIPTREEMREIEVSSRLYIEKNTLYMTATMVAQSDTPDPKFDAVTFALTQTQLVTIRYIEPQAFKLFSNYLTRSHKADCQVIDIFIALLEATVDRLADILEMVGHQLDAYSNHIFQHDQSKERPDYQAVMQNIGLKSNLNTKARESLVTFGRLIAFFWQSADARIDKEGQLRLANLNKDLSSLSDYANFISNKVNFLLDATLGMINIEQNAIIKIFSVAAVIFLPPTLIASIYGMNFQYMPELSSKWGYFIALGLMGLSAWLPYKYFKFKRWL